MQKYDPGIIGEALYALQKEARQIALVTDTPLIGATLSPGTVLAIAPASSIFGAVENRVALNDFDNHSVLPVRPVQLNIMIDGTARSLVLLRDNGAVIYVIAVEPLQVDSGNIIETPAFEARLNATGA